MKTLRPRLEAASPARKLWRTDEQRGDRHQRGYGTAWVKLRKDILHRDSGLCQPCLKNGHVTAAAVDHIIPKVEGGTDDPSNLQSICTPCHDAKSRDEMKHRGRG